MTTSKTTAGPATTMHYTILPERMPAIPPEQMSDAQRKAAAGIAAGPRGEVKGPFPAMLRSPELTERMQRLGEYIRFGSELDPRVRTVASLMTIRYWTNQYAWAGHARQALKAGVDPAVVEAIAEGRRPVQMPEDEELVYDFMTELYANKGVSDPTYARAVAKFGEKNIIDLLGVVSYFGALALMMNVTRTASPSGKHPLAPLPVQLRPE